MAARPDQRHGPAVERRHGLEKVRNAFPRDQPADVENDALARRQAQRAPGFGLVAVIEHGVIDAIVDGRQRLGRRSHADGDRRQVVADTDHRVGALERVADLRGDDRILRHHFQVRPAAAEHHRNAGRAGRRNRGEALRIKKVPQYDIRPHLAHELCERPRQQQAIESAGELGQREVCDAVRRNGARRKSSGEVCTTSRLASARRTSAGYCGTEQHTVRSANSRSAEIVAQIGAPR